MLREALTEQRLRSMPTDEAAALWVSRRAEGLTDRERALLDKWLSGHPDHLRAFERADQAWHAFAATDGDEMLAAMRRHARANVHMPRRPTPVWTRIAAMLLVVAASTFLIVYVYESRPTASPQTGRSGPGRPDTIYASAKGESKTIGLPDGSQMTLDTDTLARATPGEGTRKIRLVRGRAYFAVAHDPKRPFVVEAGNHEVLAFGTKFDVRSERAQLVVRLLEGSVTVRSVTRGWPGVQLLPGQSFTERQGQAVIGRVRDPTEALAWLQGFADFDDATLLEAAEEMNRYSTKQIVIRDPGVGGLLISGQFRTGDSERFVRTVAEIYPIRAVAKGNERIEIARSR